MANKRNKKRYTQVPKPVKRSNRKVNCYKCGTNNGYSLKDMIEHDSWCALAQAKAKAATRQREACAGKGTNRCRSPRPNHHHPHKVRCPPVQD